MRESRRPVAKTSRRALHRVPPSKRAKAAGAPVDVGVGKLEPGQQVTVAWPERPVWVLRRTERMLEDLKRPELLRRLVDPGSAVASQPPPYAQNA